jgi:hypothetical protein
VAIGIVKAGTGVTLGIALGDASLTLQAAAAMVLEGGAEEFRHRLLSARERSRVDRVVALGRTHIEEKLRLGYELRSDGFFGSGPGLQEGRISHRSVADEIVEGVLLVAQRQHQEKKIPYLAFLLANIAFDDASADLTNHLIRLADQLSYRQLCLIALFEAKDRYRLHVGKYLEAAEPSNEMQSLIGELLDLEDRGLAMSDGSTDGAFLRRSTGPDKGPGMKLYQLMELWRISNDDLAPIAELLKR